MGRADFDKILDEQRNEAKNYDWDSRKQEWLSAVQRLYDQVTSYLYDYIQDGRVTLDRTPKTLQEQLIGTYETEKLIVVVDDTRIEFDPVGTFIVGAHGRVDVHSNSGKATLVLVPESITGVAVHIASSTTEEDRKNPRSPSNEVRNTATESKFWKIATEPPEVRYIPLDEEMFFDLMVELLGGSTSF